MGGYSRTAGAVGLPLPATLGNQANSDRCLKLQFTNTWEAAHAHLSSRMPLSNSVDNTEAD